MSPGLCHCALPALDARENVQGAQQNQSVESRVMGDQGDPIILHRVVEVLRRDRVLPRLPYFFWNCLEGVRYDQTDCCSGIQICAERNVYVAVSLSIHKEALGQVRSKYCLNIRRI